jgi:antirestriction protein ArdC
MKTKERPKRRERTPADKEAAKAKRTLLKAMTKQAESKGEPDWPVVTIEGHALSPINCSLVIMQCPVARTVGGFGQWRKNRRQVRKGQKGIMIWFPSKTRQEGEDEDGEGEGGGGRKFFRVGTVFDISQTDKVGSNHEAETDTEHGEGPKHEESETESEREPDYSELLAALTF